MNAESVSGVEYLYAGMSVFRLFLRIKKTSIKIDQMFPKCGQNIDKISKLSKDRLDSGKWLDNPSLITVSKH